MPKAPKSKKVVHPNSRQATYIQKKAHRDHKLMKNKAEASIKQEQFQQKLLWYQEHLDPQKSMYTKHGVAELTLDYINRFKDELEQIVIVNSVGGRQTKQHQSRETAIKLTMERENYEFDSVGIEVPDLINGKNLEYFRKWTGEIRYFPNIKFRKAKRSDLKADDIGDEDDNEKDSQSDLPDYVDSEEEDKDETVSGSDELPDYVDKE